MNRNSDRPVPVDFISLMDSINRVTQELFGLSCECRFAALPRTLEICDGTVFERVDMYQTSAASAYLRGGRLASLDLAQLQALSGTLSLTVNGVKRTSGLISLANANCLGSAVKIIQAGFSSPGFTVGFDSSRGGYVFLSSATGTTSTISYATGALAAGLKLTLDTGAVLSQGSEAALAGAWSVLASEASQAAGYIRSALINLADNGPRWMRMPSSGFPHIDPAAASLGMELLALAEAWAGREQEDFAQHLRERRALGPDAFEAQRSFNPDRGMFGKYQLGALLEARQVGFVMVEFQELLTALRDSRQPPASVPNEIGAGLEKPPQQRDPPRHEQQEAAIVNVLRALGFDPRALPKTTGKPGAKAQARQALPLYSEAVFDKAWKRLRASRAIEGG